MKFAAQKKSFWKQIVFNDLITKPRPRVWAPQGGVQPSLKCCGVLCRNVCFSRNTGKVYFLTWMLHQVMSLL